MMPFKKSSLWIVVVLGALLLPAQEKKATADGGLDLYLGFFDLSNPNIDVYVPAVNAKAVLINVTSKKLTFSDRSDDKGSIRIESLEPGTYILGIDAESGSFLFRKSGLNIRERENTKLYLHLERTDHLGEIVEEAKKHEIRDYLPRLIGETVEIMSSRGKKPLQEKTSIRDIK